MGTDDALERFDRGEMINDYTLMKAAFGQPVPLKAYRASTIHEAAQKARGDGFDGSLRFQVTYDVEVAA